MIWKNGISIDSSFLNFLELIIQSLDKSYSRQFYEDNIPYAASGFTLNGLITSLRCIKGSLKCPSLTTLSLLSNCTNFQVCFIIISSSVTNFALRLLGNTQITKWYKSLNPTWMNGVLLIFSATRLICYWSSVFLIRLLLFLSYFLIFVIFSNVSIDLYLKVLTSRMKTEW